MDGVQWGTVAQWMSAVFSSGSVGLALFIILRDRKKAQESDARQVVFWKSHVGRKANRQSYLHVFNGTSRAIPGGMVICSFGRHPDKGTRRLDGGGSFGLIRAGREDKFEVVGFPLLVEFTDADGFAWIKDIESGVLVKSPRPRYVEAANEIAEIVGAQWAESGSVLRHLPGARRIKMRRIKGWAYRNPKRSPRARWRSRRSMRARQKEIRARLERKRERAIERAAAESRSDGDQDDGL